MKTNIPKVLAVVIYLAAAAAVACFFLLYIHINGGNSSVFTLGSWGDALSLSNLLLFSSLISPLIFVFASWVALDNPRVGYITGLLGGFIALPWFIWTEWTLSNFGLINTWITFNLPDRDDLGYTLLSKFKILSVGLIVNAIVVSAVRLISPRWTLRKSHLSSLTWPAFVVCFLVIAVWFGWAVMPYRVPLIVDAIRPDLAILHVEKSGLQFHETSVRIWRDRRLWVSRNNRRLFQYQFRQSVAEGLTPPTVAEHVLALMQSGQLQGARGWPRALRTWRAEGWYVLTGRTGSGILHFTTELGTEPPKQLTDLFHELESLETAQSWNNYARDVCLGFCYDPPAGLGIQYVNSRCTTDTQGTRCQ